MKKGCLWLWGRKAKDDRGVKDMTSDPGGFPYVVTSQFLFCIGCKLCQAMSFLGLPWDQATMNWRNRLFHSNVFFVNESHSILPRNHLWLARLKEIGLLRVRPWHPWCRYFIFIFGLQVFIRQIRCPSCHAWMMISIVIDGAAYFLLRARSEKFFW
jgi:hypothetical protein